jgi:hypothetical protein
MSKTKEVHEYARKRYDGPAGAGPMTGRGLGRCSGSNVLKYGADWAAGSA